MNASGSRWCVSCESVSLCAFVLYLRMLIFLLYTLSLSLSLALSLLSFHGPILSFSISSSLPSLPATLAIFASRYSTLYQHVTARGKGWGWPWHRWWRRNEHVSQVTLPIGMYIASLLSSFFFIIPLPSLITISFLCYALEGESASQLAGQTDKHPHLRRLFIRTK